MVKTWIFTIADTYYAVLGTDVMFVKFHVIFLLHSKTADGFFVPPDCKQRYNIKVEYAAISTHHSK